MFFFQVIMMLYVFSVGSLIRREFGAERSAERGAKMCSVTSSLKRIAHLFNVAVVVTNHVTSKVDAFSDDNVDSNKETVLIPALGPSWSHWVNSRLYLSARHGKRWMCIAKSPELPELVVEYCVSKKGVEVSPDFCMSSGNQQR